MDIRIAAKNFDLKEPLKSYIEKKIDKLKKFERVISVNITLEKGSPNSKVECEAKFGAADPFVAIEYDKNLRRAFLRAFEHIERKITEYKDKLAHRH